MDFVSSTRIEATFDLTAQPMTSYDLVVRNPDGQEGRLTKAFSVDAPCGAGAALSIMLLGLMMGLLSIPGIRGIWRCRMRKTE